MKTSAIVIAALMSTCSAITLQENKESLSQTKSLSAIYQEVNIRTAEKVKNMKDEEFMSLVHQKIKDAEAGVEKPEDKKEDAVKKDGELKAVEEALAKKILGRLEYAPYPYAASYPVGYSGYYPYTYYNYPTGYDIYGALDTVRYYHDLVHSYEVKNAIAGEVVAPIVADIATVLGLSFDEKTKGLVKAPNANKEETKAAPAPAKEAALQLDSEGVPVTVQPVLRPNYAQKSDLRQRNYVIDGVDGFDLVQTKDSRNNVPTDLTVLQVNGEAVKVFSNDEGLFIQLGASLGNPVVNPPYNNWSVNQPSVPHQHGMIGTEDLQQRGIIIDGVDYNYLQTSNPVVNPPFNNWSVNQPSPPHQWGMIGTEDLQQRNIIIDGVDYDFLQTGAEVTNPVVNPPFNNWSVNQPSPPHQWGMIGTEDLQQRNIIIDGVDYDFVQTGAEVTNPVVNPPFNNWSVNQPSPPHQWGMIGTEDLQQRNIIIDGVDYNFIQLKNPVVNPPLNNWSVNQPSPPHDKGMNGTEDLGQDIIIGGENIHYAQKKAKEPVEDLHETITIDGQKLSYAQKHAKEPVEDLHQTITIGGEKISYAQKK